MNEPDFEQQLRAIQPAAPRRAVEDRIAADLAPIPAAGALLPPRRSWLERLLPALGWSVAGAAAAVVALHFSQPQVEAPGPEVSSQLAAATPPDVELEHQLLDVAEAGIVDGSADGLARVVRYESVERRRWVGDDGAVTVVELPREDFVLVPISFQ